jgi:hypothetical protein
MKSGGLHPAILETSQNTTSLSHDFVVRRWHVFVLFWSGLRVRVRGEGLGVRS